MTVNKSLYCMFRLLIFAITMLLLSSICNGQGVSNFGATRAQDTSRTPAQLKLPAYGGSLDTMLLTIMPNGDVKKVAKNQFGATYLAGYGLGLTGNTFFVDTVAIATQYDLSQIPQIDTASLSSRIDSKISYIDTLTTILTRSSVSNGSIPKSSTQTNTIPTQNAVSRLVDLRAATSVGTPYLWLIVDTPYVKLSAGNRIDSMFDASENARHFGQTVNANRSIFNASGGMNNQPYASFSDDATFPSKYSSSTITLDTTYTMFIVFRVNKPVPATNTFFLGSSSSACMQVTSTGGIAYGLSSGQTGAFRGGANNYMINEVNRIGRVVDYLVGGVELPASNTSATTGTFNWNGLGNTFASAGQYADMNFHELIAYDTRLTGEQLYKVRRYLQGKYGGISGGLFCVGDSWTAGPTDGTRYSTKLAGYLGMMEINQGISGTVLESIASPELNNVYDRKQFMPYGPKGEGYAVVMIGGNDVTRADKTAYNPMLYKFQLSTVANTLLNKGWERWETVIANQARFTGQTQARWDSFANAALEVARELNVMGADVNTLFGNNIANNAGIGGDGIHPTSTQSDTLAKFIRNVIYNGWTKDTVTLVSGSYRWLIPNALPYVFTGTTSTWTLPPVIGNSGGVINIKNRGSGTVTINAYAGANEIFTNAAVNTYALTTGSAIILRCDGTYWLIE